MPLYAVRVAPFTSRPLLAAKYCVASQDYRRQILRRFVKLRANPIAKSTNFWPRLVAAPADEMISMSANREFGAEGHDEAAGLQIIERDGLMAEHDARSFNRGVDRVIGGIETQAARWIDIVYANDAEPIRPTRRLRKRRRRLNVNERMPGKVGGAA
jgi:hypothetical protein